jgi:hypothetical protein
VPYGRYLRGVGGKGRCWRRRAMRAADLQATGAGVAPDVSDLKSITYGNALGGSAGGEAALRFSGIFASRVASRGAAVARLAACKML